MTAEYLRRRYGDIVRVEYVDFALPQVQTEHAAVLAQIEAQRMEFPVLEIDGRFISHGFVDYAAITAILDQKAQDVTRNSD